MKYWWQPMTLETYISRCRKITLESIDFTYVFRWVKLRGSTLCKGLEAMLPLPVKWLRLTACLQRRHIDCGGWRHKTPIPHEISIHKANFSWNLYQIKYQTCTRYDIFFKAVLDYSWIQTKLCSNLYQMWHIVQCYSNKKKMCFKCIWDIIYTFKTILDHSWI